MNSVARSWSEASGTLVPFGSLMPPWVPAGKITVDRPCQFDSDPGNPGLGWGSKYYLENHPALIDTPGEWWYDARNSWLYLWPPAPGYPATLNIEISRRDAGVNLENRSYITLDGLAIELLNGNAVDHLSFAERGLVKQEYSTPSEVKAA